MHPNMVRLGKEKEGNLITGINSMIVAWVTS